MIEIRSPSHPGGFLKRMVLEPLGLNVTQAAKALGVTRTALSMLVNERVSLSAEMAIRIHKAFGPDMETMMGMQHGWDVAQAKKRQGEIAVARYTRKAAKPDQRAGFR